MRFISKILTGYATASSDTRDLTRELMSDVLLIQSRCEQIIVQMSSNERYYPSLWLPIEL